MKSSIAFNAVLLAVVVISCSTVLVQQTPQPFIGHDQGNAYWPGPYNQPTNPPHSRPGLPPMPVLVIHRASVAVPPPYTNGQPYCMTNRFGVRCGIWSNPVPVFQNLAWKFAPTTFTNLTAFVQTRASLTNAWTVLWHTNYPTNGGTFTFPVPTTGMGFQRAGYGVP